MEYRHYIDQFFKGELSREEAKEFLEFLESKEAENHFTKEIIEFWTSKIDKEEFIWDDKEVWTSINSSLKFDSSQTLTNTNKNRNYSFSIWLRAAVILVVLGLSTVFYFYSKSIESSTNTQVLSQIEEEVTNFNPRGQKTKISLEDGSQVYLNSESRITYPKNFKTNRIIKLEGEAFFEVAEDPNHPFQVEANGVVTTALGTSFNVSSFFKDQHVAVTLLTGKVKLTIPGKDNFIDLIPGEETRISAENPVMEKYQVNAEDRILWTLGVLKFDEASFQDMVEVLERWYGVTFSVTGEPNTLKASGVFDPQESLRNVLQVMSQTLDFGYEIEEQSITINFN
jgi:transmembrane sensor